MSAQFPDVSTIRSALMLACRAPSVHNTQPWMWRVGTHSLHLYANRDLHLPYTDPDARDLMLSCGAALNHCVVAFAALGWQCKIHRLPNPADPDHLAAIDLHRHLPSEADVALAAAIPRRRTDRRTYGWWPVPHRDIVLMGARAARAGVMLRRMDALDDLKRIVADAVWQRHSDYGYHAELAAWSGGYAATAGAVLVQSPDADLTEDDAAVIALGTAEDDTMARLRAGEATSLVLLTATALGLASCPITEPLEIAETRAAVQADVFGEEAYPQMLLRIGWAPVNADPLPFTPRHDLSEVVTRLDGSPLG